MIIDSLLELIYNLLNLLLVFEIPSFPEQFTTVFSSFAGYILSGLGILRAFLGPTAFSYLGILLGLIVAFNAAYIIYSLVFWVIRKIPVANVRE